MERAWAGAEHGTSLVDIRGPPAGAGSVGLEEYVVEAVSGDPVGKVVTMVERADRVYLVVERGLPPLRHDLRAVLWAEVEKVDHAALIVRLRPTSEEFDQALGSIPRRESRADRRRPSARFPAADRTSPDVPGPVDRTGPYTTLFALAAVGPIVLLPSSCVRPAWTSPGSTGSFRFQPPSSWPLWQAGTG